MLRYHFVGQEGYWVEAIGLFGAEQVVRYENYWEI